MWLTVGALIAAILSGLLIGWWLLIASEGVYLGRRVVVWLYDVVAPKYNGIKNFHADWDSEFLAEPLLTQLPNSPLILDVAAGTGRLSIALHAEPGFTGQVINLDPSLPMIKAGITTPDHAELHVHGWGETLPFATDCFEAVACLEALEFVQDRQRVISECIRVLKPGGVLLLTNRKNTRMMPGRVYPTQQVAQALSEQGLVTVSSERWTTDYELIWAVKASPNNVSK
jgi:ubiquinone/menaquinone biosynthesis C-methylase UbiE